jgi:hypothetical protein
MKKAVDAWNNNKFFGTLVPEPDYKTTPVKKTYPEISAQYAKTDEERVEVLKNEPTIREDAWWDWRVQNWGTKWEVCSDEAWHEVIEKDGKIEFRASFSTAWSPPTDFYDRLVEQGYVVDAKYYEGGCAFCGWYVDGDDSCYNLDGDWKNIRKTIPRELDDEFDIVQGILEYKHQDLLDEIEAITEQLSEEKDNHELIKELAEKKAELTEMDKAFEDLS